MHAIVARDPPLQSIFLELFSRVCTWKLFDDRESYVVTSFVDVIAFPAARCIGTVVVIEHVEGSVGTLTACRNLERLTELVVEDCTGYVHRKSVSRDTVNNVTNGLESVYLSFTYLIRVLIRVCKFVQGQIACFIGLATK